MGAFGSLLRGVSEKARTENLITATHTQCLLAMERSVSSKWPKLMLMSAVTAAWLVYDIATAIEAPRPVVAYMQYAFLAIAVIGFFGSLLNYVLEK
jgi:hypothetical protein